MDKSEWTRQEKRWLLEFLESPGASGLEDLMREEFRARLAEPVTINPGLSERMLENIHTKTGMIKKPGRKIFSMWFVRVAAASVVFLIAAIFYFSQKEMKHTDIVKNENSSILKNDIVPGGNKAVLTLANGFTIILDSVQNGTLTSQGNMTIIKLDDGQLAYNQSGVAGNSEILYNTISTPRGGQYQLTLSDGSKVWLNAESSLRFPAAFSGKERKVELTGEGYFEVAHISSSAAGGSKEAKPFIVTVNNTSVEVLGTHFNINAYPDEEEMKITLLEGSVKVRAGNESALLQPGEQAQLQSLNHKLSTGNVDVDAVVAWKNGYFQFDNSSLKEVMRQLSRWYDVDVEYIGSSTLRKFGGSISRKSDLAEVLKILEESKVHFKIEGKKILVTHQ